MYVKVLPITFVIGASFLWAQSAASVQNPPKRVVPAEVVANDVAPAVMWEDPHQKLERAQTVNAVMAHQLALRRDTEKLLALAEELKQNVDKTGANILSMEVIKKAQEIEKLAKNVQEKMKQAY